ncbi:MAG: ATP-binding protein [Nitrospiraceae bacterium]
MTADLPRPCAHGLTFGRRRRTVLPHAPPSRTGVTAHHAHASTLSDARDHRGRLPVSRKAGGTGLGTKIVKDVVDAHGGRIAVESEVGKDTTFYLTLPIEGPAAPVRARPAAPAQ